MPGAASGLQGVYTVQRDDVGFREFLADVSKGRIGLAMIKRLELIPTGKLNDDEALGLPCALKDFGVSTSGTIDAAVFSGDLRDVFNVTTVPIGLHVGRIDIGNQKGAHGFGS